MGLGKPLEKFCEMKKSRIKNKNISEPRHFGRGQPTKYDPKYVNTGKMLAQLGATDEQIAMAFNVSVVTIRNWYVKFPDFFVAIKAQKQAANDRVERSLYERANGYNYPAVKIFCPAGSKEPVVVHYEEHCPPDVGAAFIWLKNRDHDHWRDVQNLEHVLGKYLISDKPMTEEEWARERATIIDEKAIDVTPAIPQGNGKSRK
jgi:hypothetical protein